MRSPSSLSSLAEAMGVGGDRLQVKRKFGGK